MKAMKPIFRTKQYIKYGFVKMEHEYCCSYVVLHNRLNRILKAP